MRNVDEIIDCDMVLFKDGVPYCGYYDYLLRCDDLIERDNCQYLLDLEEKSKQEVGCKYSQNSKEVKNE